MRIQRFLYLACGLAACLLPTLTHASSWQVIRTAEIHADIADVFLLRDGIHGWLATNRGPYRTEDGGASWEAGVLPFEVGLDALHFLDENDGWAVSDGYGGTIFHSTDGGRTWEVNYVLPDGWMTDIFFTDALHGWATADHNVLRTTDGGVSWTVDYHFGWYPAEVYFHDNLRGWMGGDDIYVTEDGGASWVITNGGIYASGIGFADSLRGCAVGIEGAWPNETAKIFYTTDGGHTWFPPGSPAILQGLRDVDLDASGRGYAAGNYGTILLTEDGGQSWTSQTSGVQNLLRSVCVRSGRTWAAGSFGTVLGEPGVGLTGWSRVTTIGNTLRDAAFGDEQHGIIVGDAGLIFRTEDGGQTWQEVWVWGCRDANVVSVDMVGSDLAWMCGLYTGGGVYRSLDGGVSWESVPLPITGHDYSVDFADASNGWCTVTVVSGSSICHSTDGGASWSEQPAGAAWYWDDVFALDALHGWAGGWEPDHGLVGRTVDGGATWTFHPLPTSDAVYGLFFRTERLGWAATGGGTVYQTDDGGDTWNAIHQAEANAAWLAVKPVGPDNLAVVGARNEGNATTGLIDRGSLASAAWMRDLESPGSWLLGAEFGSAQSGFAVGFYGEIFGWEPTLETSPPPEPGALVLGVIGNPSRGTTVFEIVSPGRSGGVRETGTSSIDLFDVRGVLVRTLSAPIGEPGLHHVSWDGRLNGGNMAPAGVYLARLRSAGGCATTRFVRLP